MSSEDATRLNETQSSYETDPSNPQRLYEYFQELNKHQFYLTVVREYEAFAEANAIKNNRNLG